MKKAENFDEIFAQRGEQVQPEKGGKSGYFLLTHREYFCGDATNSIAFVEAWTDLKIAEVKDQIFLNTGYYYEGGLTNLEAVFKATPDQIELLNSYRV